MFAKKATVVVQWRKKKRNDVKMEDIDQIIESFIDGTANNEDFQVLDLLYLYSYSLFNLSQDRFHKNNQSDLQFKLASVSLDSKKLSYEILKDRKLVKVIKDDIEFRIVDIADYSLFKGVECLVKEGSFQDHDDEYE